MTDLSTRRATDRRPHNRQLAALIAEAGFSNAGLARRVDQLGVEHGLDLRYDKTSVTRWLRGQQPRGTTPALIAEVFTRRLGRRLSAQDLGLDGATPVYAGLEFAGSPREAVEIVCALWRKDTGSQADLRRIAFSAAGLVVPSRDWLIGRADERVAHGDGALPGAPATAPSGQNGQAGHAGSAEQTGLSGQPGRAAHPGHGGRAEQDEQTGLSDHLGRADQAGRRGQAGNNGQTGLSGHVLQAPGPLGTPGAALNGAHTTVNGGVAKPGVPAQAAPGAGGAVPQAAGPGGRPRVPGQTRGTALPPGRTAVSRASATAPRRPGVSGAVALPDGSGQRVTAGDIAALRSVGDLFRSLDNAYGGGHARQALVRYLEHEAEPMLRGSYGEAVGRRLFGAVADLTRLAGWTSYDIGAHGLAQRYFVQALRLSQAAGDRIYGGYVLVTMSRQAVYLGHGREAVQLARVAQQGVGTNAPPVVQALLHAAEARAAGLLGEVRACTAALARAERALAAARSGDEVPHWARFFDEAQLADEFGHCHRDLRQFRAAAQHAERSLQLRGHSYARSRLFCRTVLATARIGLGEIETACSHGHELLAQVVEMRSLRAWEYVRDFGRRLEPHRELPVAKAYLERAAALGLA
jgi:tetratricopeptide (TPR) repeat protein